MHVNNKTNYPSPHLWPMELGSIKEAIYPYLQEHLKNLQILAASIHETIHIAKNPRTRKIELIDYPCPKISFRVTEMGHVWIVIPRIHEEILSRTVYSPTLGKYGTKKNLSYEEGKNKLEEYSPPLTLEIYNFAMRNGTSFNKQGYIEKNDWSLITEKYHGSLNSLCQSTTTSLPATVKLHDGMIYLFTQLILSRGFVHSNINAHNVVYIKDSNNSFKPRLNNFNNSSEALQLNEEDLKNLDRFYIQDDRIKNSFTNQLVNYLFSLNLNSVVRTPYVKFTYLRFIASLHGDNPNCPPSLNVANFYEMLETIYECELNQILDPSEDDTWKIWIEGFLFKVPMGEILRRLETFVNRDFLKYPA